VATRLNPKPMGRISCRQGSAELSHVPMRAPRLGMALFTVLALGLLVAGPAMGSTVTVGAGPTLLFNAPEVAGSNVAITQSGSDFQVSDSAGVTAQAPC